MCRQWSIQSQMGCLYQTLPSWLRHLMAKSKQKRREVVMTLRKQHLPDSKGPMHTWAQRLQHGEDLPKVKLDKNPSTVAQSHSPESRSYLQLIPMGRGKVSFLQRNVPKQASCLRVVDQYKNGLHGFCVGFFCCCCCSCYCLAFLSFLFCFIVCLFGLFFLTARENNLSRKVWMFWKDLW